MGLRDHGLPRAAQRVRDARLSLHHPHGDGPATEQHPRVSGRHVHGGSRRGVRRACQLERHDAE